LLDSKGIVQSMADALVAQETLAQAELKDLLGERPFPVMANTA
jgi:hypothetical protein